MSAALVTLLVENACIGRSAGELRVPQLRRDVTRELEHQIQRAMWRADRRGRGLPLDVRQSVGWVNAQRRKIAWELFRALRSMGAGAELASSAATIACERFPRDGIIINDADPRRPREQGTSPRQRAKNPRARGESPRQRGTSPRQQRAAAASVHVPAAIFADGRPAIFADGRPVDVNHALATFPARYAEFRPGGEQLGQEPRPIDELAPGWSELKQQLLAGLSDEERIRARHAAQLERERLEQLNRRSKRE